jgi:hypothetical protein
VWGNWGGVWDMVGVGNLLYNGHGSFKNLSSTLLQLTILECVCFHVNIKIN